VLVRKVNSAVADTDCGTKVSTFSPTARLLVEASLRDNDEYDTCMSSLLCPSAAVPTYSLRGGARPSLCPSTAIGAAPSPDSGTAPTTYSRHKTAASESGHSMTRLHSPPLCAMRPPSLRALSKTMPNNLHSDGAGGKRLLRRMTIGLPVDMLQKSWQL